VLQLASWFVVGWERWRKMLMCAAVSVMVCGRVGEMEENVDVCCS